MALSKFARIAFSVVFDWKLIIFESSFARSFEKKKKKRWNRSVNFDRRVSRPSEITRQRTRLLWRISRYALSETTFIYYLPSVSASSSVRPLRPLRLLRRFSRFRKSCGDRLYWPYSRRRWDTTGQIDLSTTGQEADVTTHATRCSYFIDTSSDMPHEMPTYDSREHVTTESPFVAPSPSEKMILRRFADFVSVALTILFGVSFEKGGKKKRRRLFPVNRDPETYVSIDYEFFFFFFLLFFLMIPTDVDCAVTVANVFFFIIISILNVQKRRKKRPISYSFIVVHLFRILWASFYKTRENQGAWM